MAERVPIDRVAKVMVAWPGPVGDMIRQYAMSSIAATALPAPVQSYLRRFALRRGVQRVVRRVGLAALVTLAWGLAWCLVDRALALPAGVRVGVLGINVAMVLWIVGPAVGRMIGRVDYQHAAREAERREPDWQERLATVASRALGPARLAGSKELLGALAADVEKEAARRAPGELLPWGPVLRPWIASGVMLLLAGSLGFIATLDLPRLARRYFTPLADVAPAATTRLFVTPGDVSLAAGETLRVRASAQRMPAGAPTLHVRAADDTSDEWMAQPMSATPPAAFEARIANLERDMVYYVSGGDARSDLYRVTVLRRPAITTLRMKLDWPPYLKLPPRQIEKLHGAVDLLAGTTVTLEMEASEPLSDARLIIGREEIATTPAGRPHVRRATFSAEHAGALTIRMTSAAGVSGTFTGGRVRVRGDRPPGVTLGSAAGGTPPARLSYHAVDDFALARVDAEITHGLGQQKVVALPLTGDVRQQSGVLVLDAASLGLQAGETVDLQLRVEDRAGHFTVSPRVRLRVGSAPAPAAAGEAPEPSPEPLQAVDPTGFSESLEAYLDAIAKPR